MKITDKLQKNKIAQMAKDYNVNYIGLFGSFAKGKESPDSDIDLLFDYNRDEKFSLFDLYDLQKQLEELFGREIDLVPVGGLKDGIKEEVLNSVIDLYGER